MSDQYSTIPEGSLAEPAIEALDNEILEVESDDAQTKDAVEMSEVRDRLGVTEMIDPLRALLEAPTGPVTSTWSCPRLQTEFVVKAMTSREYNQVQERATRFTRNKRTGRMDRDLDATIMSLLVCSLGTITPDFKDPQLASRYPNMQSHDIVSACLLPGEVDSLASKILTLSGFDEDLEETGKD
jgi:hypothetical protein